MNENQRFAADVVTMIPEGAVWTFRNHYKKFNSFMQGIDCVEVAPSDWQATIGNQEKLLLLELLEWEDEDSYWMFGGAESIEIEFDGQLILRSWDGMNVVDFSKDFAVPDTFRQKYFADCAGYAHDW
jgi:hypothetical protein